MFGKSWTKGADYFRMDGSTSVQLRSAWSAHFNDPENYRYLLLVLLTQQWLLFVKSSRVWKKNLPWIFIMRIIALLTN